MIGSLRGRLLHRGSGEIIVEVAGIGYVVVVSPTTAVAVGDVDDEAFVWVHHHLREDAETLYGFGTRAEKVTFEALLGAHGVGPSMALAILSVHAPAALVRILADDDVAALCLVPGVGKKTAARLLVDLRLAIANGSLGYAVRLRIALEPVKRYVELRHVRYGSLTAMTEALARISEEGRYDDEEVDFLDGIVFSADESYLCLGRRTDEPGCVRRRGLARK